MPDEVQQVDELEFWKARAALLEQELEAAEVKSLPDTGAIPEDRVRKVITPEAPATPEAPKGGYLGPARPRSLAFRRYTRKFSREEFDAALDDGGADRVRWMSAVQQLRNDKYKGRDPLKWTSGRRAAEDFMFSMIQATLHLHVLAREELTKRVIDLEAKLAEVETKSVAGALVYRGVWRDGEVYPPGVFVTSRGSLWHANAETTASPGTSSDWSLAVKRGRDGRSHGGHDHGDA
jgi:hypothetical protein